MLKLNQGHTVVVESAGSGMDGKIFWGYGGTNILGRGRVAKNFGRWVAKRFWRVVWQIFLGWGGKRKLGIVRQFFGGGVAIFSGWGGSYRY